MKPDNRYLEKIQNAIDSLVKEETDKINDDLSNRIIDVYSAFKEFKNPLFLKSPFKMAELSEKAINLLQEQESFSLVIPKENKHFIMVLKDNHHCQVVRHDEKFIFSLFKGEDIACIFELLLSKYSKIQGILKEDWVTYDHINFIVFIFFTTYKIKQEK